MSTSSNASGSYDVEALRGSENYAAWRVQITASLRDMDLWDYVEGKKPRPTVKGEQRAWDESDRRALTVIQLRVSSAMKTYTSSHKTSKGAFDALATVLNAQGSAAARRKLFSHQIEEGADMGEEIRRMQQFKEELACVDPHPRPYEETFTYTLLAALPPSWNAFLSAIGTAPSLADVIDRILQEEGRRKERGRTGSDVSTASAPSRQDSRSSSRPDVSCQHSGKEGHLRPDCRNLAGSRSSAAPNRQDGPPRVPPSRIDGHKVPTQSSAPSSNASWYTWHCRLGHLDKAQLQQMFYNQTATGMDVDLSSDINFHCPTCTEISLFS